MHNQHINRIATLCAVATLATANANAQSGTNSPYSQYGMGILSDQSQSASRGMAGLGIGLRSHAYANTLNPASYSAVDSLTMIFDVGMTGQITSFKEGGVKVNANNANFEYAVALFRLYPHLGMSLSLLPYSNVGYSYSTSTKVGSSTTTASQAYSGTGGLHKANIGLGWEFMKGFSVGANFAYLWGTLDRTVTNTYSDTYVNSLSRSYNASVRSFDLNVGAQASFVTGKADLVTVGIVYGLGHSLHSDPTLITTNSNPQTSVASNDTLTARNGLRIPHTFGAGITWTHGGSLTVGLDYTLQKWGSVDFPTMSNTGTASYHAQAGQLSDRHKLTIGGEWMPNALSRSLLKRIAYRVGASYNTPYIKVNGSDGPKEYGVTAGLGIPLTNSWNNRSVLNVSAGWTHAAAKGYITENTFRINVGLTFNERWFMKWKVE